MDSFNLQRVQSWLFVIGLEAALLAVVVCVLYVATQVILSRLEARNRARAEWVAPLKVKARRILVSALFLLIVAVLMANAALLIYGVDVRSSVVDPIVSITAQRRGELAAALGKLALAAVALLVLTRPVRGLIAAAETAINRWGQLKANSESLARFFKGLYRLIVTAAWMLLAVLACGWLWLPPQVGDAVMVLHPHLPHDLYRHPDHPEYRGHRRSARRRDPACRPTAGLDGAIRAAANAPPHVADVPGVFAVDRRVLDRPP